MVAGALNNLSVVMDLTDMLRVDELRAEAVREAERFGDAPLMRFMDGNGIGTNWILGRWDEAMATATGLSDREPSQVIGRLVLSAAGAKDAFTTNAEKAPDVLGRTRRLSLQDAVASALAWGRRRPEVLGFA